MTSNVLSAMNLDEKDPSKGYFILVKDAPGSDSNFVMSCLISKEIKQKHGIILLTLHNSLKHYHNTGLKLGHNLNTLIESGSIKSIDCLSIVADNIGNKENQRIDLLSNKKSLYGLFITIQNYVKELEEKFESVSLLFDDISEFLSLGFTLNDISLFVYKCRSLILKRNKSDLVIGIHVTSNSDTSSVLFGILAHMVDLICDVSPLKTGRSKDISGSMAISHSFIDDSKDAVDNFIKMHNYHFKLFDRGIKVFAPGTSH